MAGPYGLGDPGTERFVKPGEWLDYTIYFENQTNATAAAQEVRVTLPLDKNLDWSTFTLGEVVFNNQTDLGLNGKRTGTSEVTMTGTNYNVRTEVSIKNGIVHWYMRIVDPSTDDNWPTDPYAGFLPPNDPDTHCGEGHLSYRIMVASNAVKTATINTSASIVFDYNDAIETDPAWWNIIGHLPVTVSFDKNCSDLVLDMPANGSYAYDSGMFNVPARDGFIFDGWATTNGVIIASGLDLPYDVSEISLFAQWREEVTTRFTTVFTDGGVLITGLEDGEECPADLVIPATVGIDGVRYNVVGIEDSAFRNQRGVRTLVIKNRVKTIGAYAFYNCVNLESVTLPGSIEYVGAYAFYGCKALVRIRIDTSVDSDGNALIPAVENTAFRSVAIEGVLSVAKGVGGAYESAWIGSVVGSSWRVEENDVEPDSSWPEAETPEPKWELTDDMRLVYAAGVSKVLWDLGVAFAESDDGSGMVNSNELVIVDYNPDTNGRYSRGAEGLVLPASVAASDGRICHVTGIGGDGDGWDDGAFYGSDLENVVVPASVRVIGATAFADSMLLTNVTIVSGSELKIIESGAFSCCTSLESVNLENAELLLELGTGDDVSGVFEYCWSLTRVSIPPLVEEIGSSAFTDCSRLQTVKFDDGTLLRKIGDYAFYNCDTLAEIELVKAVSLTEIGYAAFGGDHSAYAPKIKSVVLWGGLKSVGAYAFYNAGGLNEIFCFADTPPVCGTNAFKSVARTGVLTVAEGCDEQYASGATAWIADTEGRLPPWNGTTGWTTNVSTKAEQFVMLTPDLTSDEIEEKLAQAMLLGLTERELQGGFNLLADVNPEIRMTDIKKEDGTIEVKFVVGNGFDRTEEDAAKRLLGAVNSRVQVCCMETLGEAEAGMFITPTLAIGENGVVTATFNVLESADGTEPKSLFIKIVVAKVAK